MVLKTREEVAALINHQLHGNYNKTDSPAFKSNSRYQCDRSHYGAIELRELMDFLYDGEPANKEEEIKGFGS